MAKKATKTDELTYFAKYAELQIVMVHDTKMLVNGNQLFTSPSRVLQFHDGQLRTSDPEVIEFLNDHPAHGVDFFSSEEARSEFSNPEVNPVTGENVPEVAKPRRTRPGQRAAVAAKATTAADVDAEAGEPAAPEGDDSEDAD
jgi:hypothetical protein